MTDWVDVTALILGPAIAVDITLVVDRRRSIRDRRMNLMRQLVVVKAHPGDPAFSNAVNLIPIEFGKSDRVMTALEAFNDAANKQKMTPQFTDDLLAAMMIELGFDERAAKQTARSTYLSQALASQVEVNAQAARSMIRLARSSEQSSIAATVMAEHVTGRPLPARLEEAPEQKKLI